MCVDGDELEPVVLFQVGTVRIEWQNEVYQEMCEIVQDLCLTFACVSLARQLEDLAEEIKEHRQSQVWLLSCRSDRYVAK